MDKNGLRGQPAELSERDGEPPKTQDSTMGAKARLLSPIPPSGPWEHPSVSLRLIDGSRFPDATFTLSW